MRSIILATSILLLLASTGCQALPHQPENPIMGIITDPLEECEYNPPNGSDAVQCVESFYIRWLAAAGVRSIPIPWNTTKEHRDKLLRSVNGILFPGGGLGGVVTDEYFRVTEDVVNTAIKWNKAGDPFVVWGTCMGFQYVLAAIAGNLDVIKAGFVGLFPKMLPLNFTSNQPTSRMFGNEDTPADILNVLRTQNSTLNWHQCGITPHTFSTNTAMSTTMRSLSTNVDDNGREFVSSAEGADGLAIYVTQFHPERPEFEYTNDNIGHTVGDIKVSEYLALFIASKLKLNNHTFATPEEAEAHSIHNYPIVNYGLGYELYWLPHMTPSV